MLTTVDGVLNAWTSELCHMYNPFNLHVDKFNGIFYEHATIFVNMCELKILPV